MQYMIKVVGALQPLSYITIIGDPLPEGKKIPASVRQAAETAADDHYPGEIEVYSIEKLGSVSAKKVWEVL